MPLSEKNMNNDISDIKYIGKATSLSTIKRHFFYDIFSALLEELLAVVSPFVGKTTFGETA